MQDFLKTLWKKRAGVAFGIWLGSLAGPVFATTVVPPTFEALVQEAEYVIHARVTSVESAWQERGPSRVIVTRVAVDVLETITGAPPDALVLTMLGGQVGSQRMTVEGAPQFEVGDEDILFITGNGRNFSPIARIMYGRYRIEPSADGSRQVVLRSNGEPLSRTADVSASLHQDDDQEEHAAALPALSPADFIRQIRAVNLKAPIKE